MKYEFRQYQEDAENVLLEDVLNNKEVHPVVAIPTGGGKTKILSSFIYKYLEERPSHHILVLSHTETIIKQDYEAIQEFFPEIYIGLYSSGLGSKTIHKITVAGIQSIYRVPLKFAHFDIVIVDECHTVPVRGNGMYRKFFAAVPHVIRIGLSGSPFRTGHGYVYKGKNALFNKLSVDLCSRDEFNKLVNDGYLTKLFSKPPDLQMDTSNVKMSAGDYNLKDLSEKFDRDSITKEAVKELIKFGKNYKSWLVFAIDIKHADNINEQLQEAGIPSVALHSNSDNDRHDIKEKFIKGEHRAIVSVGMITTGFDAPNIDLIALLRPTTSPILHVQMIGRGSRVCEGKDHCLVLDFAGNIPRLGPINDVQVPEKGKKKNGKGGPIVKTCPECGCLHHPLTKICDVCGHEFKFQTKLKHKFGGEEVVAESSTLKKWMPVSAVKYSIHKKFKKPNTLRVEYFCGLYRISEYVCYDHTGYAKYKADYWVRTRWRLGALPSDVKELYEYSDSLAQPYEIYVDLHSKYPVILNAKFY